MKICVCGYKGKTGSKVYELLKEEGFDVKGIEKEDKLDNRVDLLIDFTNIDNSLKNINWCIDNKIDFIVGTTGFNIEELKAIKQKCKANKIKGIISYNFALPINYLLNSFSFFNKYFNDFSYLDIHHISKIDKKSGTTTLFLSKNNKIKVKSIKTPKNSVSYIIQMRSKYDKMNITYQVDDKKAFALGIVYYLKSKDEKYLNNLLE